MSFYHGRKYLPQRFRLVLLSVLQTDGLPFSDVLSEEEIQDAFDEQGASFALEDDEVYTPAITVWAFLSQALHKGVPSKNLIRERNNKGGSPERLFASIARRWRRGATSCPRLSFVSSTRASGKTTSANRKNHAARA